MTSTPAGTDLYYDPYDFDIDADPYPVWKRLRDEAPLYYNEKHDFYALSRLRRRRALPGRLADLHLGQGIGARAHQERHGDAAGHRSSSRTRPTTTCTGAS